MVFFAVGRMPVIKGDMKTIKILLAPGGDAGHEGLRGDPGFFSGDHDGRAVGVVSANKMDLVTAHAHESHPDISLDVLHDVADVKGAVGIR